MNTKPTPEKKAPFAGDKPKKRVDYRYRFPKYPESYVRARGPSSSFWTNEKNA